MMGAIKCSCGAELRSIAAVQMHMHKEMNMEAEQIDFVKYTQQKSNDERIAKLYEHLDKTQPGSLEMGAEFLKQQKFYDLLTAGAPRPVIKPPTFWQKVGFRVTAIREAIGQWIAPTLLTEDEAQERYSDY